MTFKEIQELIKLVNKTELTEFKMRNGDFKLSIRTKNYKSEGQSQVVTAAQPLVSLPPVQPSYPAPAPHTTLPDSPAVGEKPGAAVSQDEDQAGEENYLPIKSPMVGTFYRSSAPDKPAYIKVGDTVEQGSVVCIVEAMKLFNEIESEIAGKIVKVMIEDAQPVEYDQVLFLVDPKG